MRPTGWSSNRPLADFANEGTRTFVPPLPGEALDGVLVLDDAAQHFPPPGQTKQN